MRAARPLPSLVLEGASRSSRSVRRSVPRPANKQDCSIGAVDAAECEDRHRAAGTPYRSSSDLDAAGGPVGSLRCFVRSSRLDRDQRPSRSWSRVPARQSEYGEEDHYDARRSRARPARQIPGHASTSSDSPHGGGTTSLVASSSRSRSTPVTQRGLSRPLGRQELCRDGTSRQPVSLSGGLLSTLPELPTSELPPAGRPHTGRHRNEAARSAILNAALKFLVSQGARVLQSTPSLLQPASAKRPATVVALQGCSRARSDDRAGWHRGPGARLWQRHRRSDLLPRRHVSQCEQVLGLPLTTVRDGRGTARPAGGRGAGRVSTAERRNSLRVILERGQARNELSKGADVDLLIDQAFGSCGLGCWLGMRP